jgi:transcriptional regulator of acetoin/glycerol metabolism
MIERQQFREDLYYRLNGLAVRLPPLRERTDLRTLVGRILERECADRWHVLAPDVLELFDRYRWPGNVRQLSNVLRTACVMAGQERLITRAHLSDDFIDEVRAGRDAAAAEPAAPAAAAAGAPAPAAMAAAAAPTAAREDPGDLIGPLDEVEIAAIRRAVDAAGGNISAAARRLGVSRNTIYRKLRWNQAR